jgi:alkaline phosphatase D
VLLAVRKHTMPPITRRSFLELAAAIGATTAWGGAFTANSKVPWRERREFFPEGVASGDPDATSVLLWTRRAPQPDSVAKKLVVEVAEDQAFRKVIATATTPLSADSDWTCRVLVGGLKSAHEYWYRFTDEAGNGSRIGRTITAPALDDPRPVNFAFVSCQNLNLGAQNAYRRMIYEDERAAPADRLFFVLHLGDFIYELVWYPEDRPQGYYFRTIRDILRYPHGEKIDDFHVPTDLEDYRTVYRAYLHDPELQDARARFPFVDMWDNHEFSWQGWQSVQKFNGKNRPAQKLKVAANQAFFEYRPARMLRPNSTSLEKFDPPSVQNVPVETFDDTGLGTEPNNLIAINSLRGYRNLRWGKNLDLVITDQRSYPSPDIDHPEAAAFSDKDFPNFFPEDVVKIADGGRTFNHGKPPESIPWGDGAVPNPWRNDRPQTLLGAKQKQWFLERLRESKATWKIWGNTLGTLDERADPQNLPAGITKPWPGKSYATMAGGDYALLFGERAQIYDFVRDHKITGFATVHGDRHSFWAGLAAAALPPERFEPVGVVFGVGSISAPGAFEAMESRASKKRPLDALFVGQGPQDTKPQPTINMLMRHGVRSCLEYVQSGDIEKARALSNSEMSPHLRFVDVSGHGYATVRVSPTEIQSEFVCIPRPIERTEAADGGPIRYRVRHVAKLWKPGEAPKLEQHVVEGDPKFSL